jgi:hypothetical protein
MAKTNTSFSSLSKTGAAAGATGAWLDVAAPSAFQSLANAPLPAGLSFGASISSTRLLPRFSGCFGPMAKVRMNCYESNANACQIHIVELTDMSCLFLFLLFMYFIQDDGTSHTEDEKFQGLVNFLGYLWMGEDHVLQEVSNTGESEDWFMRLARLLTNLMSSAQQIPIRVLQTVRETNKIVLIVHGSTITFACVTCWSRTNTSTCYFSLFLL